MTKEDLTPQNLKALINISVDQNEFLPDYLVFEDIVTKDPIEIFLKILWYSNFELYDIDEFRDTALQLVFNTTLEEMPLHINDNNEKGTTLDGGNTFVYYSWIRIVALWRLSIES